MTDIDDHRDRYDDDHDPKPPDEPTLADLLAETAEGTWGKEAAVWLLNQHGHWIDELDRHGLIETDDEYAEILWKRIATRSTLIGTDSERQVLDIARALAASGSTFLQDLTSLDEQNRRLVLHAIAWAMGGRDWARTLSLMPVAAGGWDGGRSSGPQTDPWSDESPF